MGKHDSPDFGAPVLYMCVDDGQFFKPKAEDDLSRESKPKPSHDGSRFTVIADRIGHVTMGETVTQYSDDSEWTRIFSTHLY